MPDEILTLPEVAQLLKVAEKTGYTMAQKGRASGVQGARAVAVLSLSALYPSGTDEKRWVDGVLARKKGLGF